MTALIALLVRQTGLGQGLATIITWGAIALAASGAITGTYFFIKHRGAEDVRAEIRDQNNEAGIHGAEARMSYGECDRRNGVYDFRTGKCSRFEAGNR